MILRQLMQGQLYTVNPSFLLWSVIGILYQRNENDLQTANARTTLYYQSFLTSVVRDWNSLPNEEIQGRNTQCEHTERKSAR